jgi:hypothetical protein
MIFVWFITRLIANNVGEPDQARPRPGRRRGRGDGHRREAADLDL